MGHGEMAVALLVTIAILVGCSTNSEKEPLSTSLQDGQLPTSSTNKQLTVRLVTELALRLPHPWYVADVNFDVASPEGWPTGPGGQIVLYQYVSHSEFKAGRFEKISLSFIPSGVTPPVPAADAGSSASVFMTWQGGRLLISDHGHKTWPSYREEVQAAVSAAEKPLGTLPRGANVFIGPVQFREIHINTDDFSHGFHRQGSVKDSATGKNFTLSLHFMHPLYEHLSGFGLDDNQDTGRHFLAVYTDRLVALVPLSDSVAVHYP